MNEALELEQTLDPEQEEERPTSLDDDEDLQREVLDKIKTTNTKGKANRMAEVSNARTARLYTKGIQRIAWSEDRQDVIFDNEENEPYSRTFNVFQGYGKMFCATFMGARPKVRAEADDPFNSDSIRNTAKAKTYERIYRKWNDTPTQQLASSRLMWTDGRVVTRTLSTEDSEITEFWGVLESRVPITAREDIKTPLKNCTLVEIEDEFPIVQGKRDYPDARKKIASGNGDSYERNARLAVKRQAGSDTAIDTLSGEDSYGLYTKTWSYMRPEFFEEFQEASRVQLQEMFPAGLLVIHSGDVYLESSECDMDSCLDVIHALPGDGMSRGSIGQPMITLQDSANTAQNLIEETFDHGIPTTYYDTRMNIDTLNTQREMPGASRKATGITGQTLPSMFFQTQAVNPSQQLLNYAENLKGPQSQFVTAMQPALNGAEMADQKTASGYAQARTMALGQMAIVWKPYTIWFSREMTRSVRMASKRQDEIKATLPPARRGGRPEATKIAPQELIGLSFTNDSDENFPETWTEKSNKVMGLLQMGGPISDWLLEQEPENVYFLKEMLGIEEIVFPGEDLRNNVLADIAQMENEPTQPDPDQMPDAPMPAVGQPPLQAPQISSIKIDAEYLEDADYEMGFKTVKHWVNSASGQEAKLSNPMWWANVRLYGMQYKQGMDAAAQAKQPPPPPPPQMGITANFKDLPPDGQVQALARDGIQVNPATVSANKEVKPVATGVA
jgi:hypothetical protein